jgi:CO/xanthine dehydrogenase FAD-binding subunit
MESGRRSTSTRPKTSPPNEEGIRDCDQRKRGNYVRAQELCGGEYFSVKPASFEYRAPRSLDEAVTVLGEHGDEGKVLAGGQSLVPLMNLRLAQPRVIVDLNGVSELSYIREEADRVCIGSMTRHRDLITSPIVREKVPMLRHAAELVGYPAIRNRGTIGGSLAHADPVSELPCVALTLDAELVLEGSEGRRTVAASEFFVTYFTTALAPTEILAEIRFPVQQAGAWDFQEFSRKTGDFALAAVGVTLAVEGRAIKEARVGMAGAADRSLRSVEAEQVLVGRALGSDAFRDAARAASDSIDPPSDAHSTGDFRRHLVGTLCERALMGSAERMRR